jgi:integral membrane protein
MFSWDTPTAKLRLVAFVEGISYLVLLFVAMPLKYLMGMPLSVRITGSIHGALFVGLAALAFSVFLSQKRTFRWGLELFVASLIPFGTFVLDGRLRREDEAFRKGAEA